MIKDEKMAATNLLSFYQHFLIALEIWNSIKKKVANKICRHQQTYFMKENENGVIISGYQLWEALQSIGIGYL